VLGKRYAPSRDQLRATAHHFVDEVVRLLTGEPGICLTRVVFSRGAGGRRDLWVVDYDGENLTRLTANRTLNLCPSWSPDGRQIAFTSYADGQQGVYLLETATGRVRRVIATEGLNLGPGWHPGGSELLMALSKDGNPEIYRVDLQGRPLRRLTVSPAIEIGPDWSPNGRDIVFTSDRTGSPQLYVMDADGAARSRLTYEGDYNDAGVWSPNGEQIAYVTRVGNRTYLVLISAGGENRRLLTDRGYTIAPNPDGPVDHDVPVLQVKGSDGKMQALVFGYACHNTTLSDYEFCGDYSGFAVQYVEQTHPGTMAMFVTGCGGDQNPIEAGCAWA